MVEQQIYRTLQENKIEQIEALYQPFDPAYHEVMLQQPTTDYPEGTVVKVFEKGYKIEDIVIRAAKVAIATIPVAESDETETGEGPTAPAEEGDEDTMDLDHPETEEPSDS